jgi:rSAM/selenodomain-associated transferase 1
MNESRLLVFLKAPRPGAVKTRLSATLGVAEACAAYRRLVERLLRQLASLENVELCFAPDDAGPEIEPWAQPDWRLTAQGSGDLGCRLDRAFRRAFDEGAQRVVIIGSDCPEAGTHDIQAAWTALLSHDVVLGPATDGGYWLIGLRAPQRELFVDIPWSTDKVLRETQKRCGVAGLTTRLLRELSDVDTEADWRRFLAKMGEK